MEQLILYVLCFCVGFVIGVLITQTRGKSRERDDFVKHLQNSKRLHKAWLKHNTWIIKD
jgi:hypothetical protein